MGAETQHAPAPASAPSIPQGASRVRFMSIFPFREGEWYSVGQLREAAKAIWDRMRSDKEFGDAMRVNDQRRFPWAKTWMEELYPCTLLSERLGLADDATFSWTPVGAADVEFRSGERTIRLQCTTAHAHWPNSLGERGGHRGNGALPLARLQPTFNTPENSFTFRANSLP